MTFSEKERKFIKDVLGIEVGENEPNGPLLAEVQDKAFDVEIAMEYGEVDEDTGEFAADLVTKLGGQWAEGFDPNH